MYQGIIGVLVLIILVGGAVMLGSRGSSPTTSMSDVSGVSTSSADVTAQAGATAVGSTLQNTASARQKSAPSAQLATVTSGGDAVSVVDQSAGNSVVVKSVSLSKLGWVAVRANGWILGAQRLQAGTYSNVTVSLLRATKAGNSYEVVLYYDNGDKVFNLHTDTIVTKADGTDLSAAFLAK